MRRHRTWRAAVLVAATAGVTLAACGSGGGTSGRVVAGGSPSLGKTAMLRYGCGSCHTIPGVKGAKALVGPPLDHFSRRTFIGGELANTPDNLVRWLVNPKAVEPGTDMPNLGVTPDDARNIAAYLEQLE
jgi:cytochrome c1